MKTTIQLLTTLICLTLGPTAARSGVVYWDSNGATPGAGATPSGIWGTDSYWSADATGASATAAWTAGDTATFSAGSDATGAFTVSVNSVSPPSAAGITVEEGTVTLTGASVAGTPTVTIKGGALKLNVNSSTLTSSPLTFSGLGIFNQDNTDAGGTINGSYGTLTFSAGNGEVRNTRAAAQTTTMTFSSLATRAVGATGLFTYDGGNAGTDNIVLTGQSAGFKKGLFLGTTAGTGANFAFYDSTGYVRSQTYSTGGTADGTGYYWLEDNAGLINNPASPMNGIAHIYKSAGNSTAQTAVGCQSIRIAGGISLGFDSVNRYFDLKAGSLLMTGNGSAQTTTISGAGSISPSSPSLTDPNNELVVRVNFSTDTLVLSCKLGVNGGTGAAFTTDNFALTKCGAGTLTLSGANTYSGSTTICQGAVKISSAAALGASGTGTTVISGAQLQTSGSLTFAEPLTLNGTGLANDGALLITANGPTISGPITLGSTGVRLQNNGAAATISGGITGSGFDLFFGGNLGWTVGTLPINIGSGTLTKDGAATTVLRLNTANTIGAINLNSGSLNVGNAGCFGAATITVAPGVGTPTDTGGILAGSGLGTLNVPNGIVLGSGTKLGMAPAGSGTVLNLAGQISGSGGALRRTRLGGTGAGTVMLSGDNTFDGGVVHVSDSLVLNHKAALGTGGTYSLGDAAVAPVAVIDVSANTDLTGANKIANPLTVNQDFTVSGSNPVEFSGNAILSVTPTVTVSSSAASILSGAISGTGFGITKAGAGTLTLQGGNSYDGATTISAGTLALSGSGSIASSSTISVVSGATFSVAGITPAGYTITGSSPQQTLAAASTSGTASVDATGKPLTLASGALVSFKADGTGSTAGKIGVTGDLNLNANAITVDVSGAALGVGTYRLMDCSGTLANSGTFGAPTITGLGLASGKVASIKVVTGAAGYVDLEVTTPPTVISPIQLGAQTNVPQTLLIIGSSKYAPQDADNDALTISAVTQGTIGSVTTDGSSVTYTATSLGTGTDSFTYTVDDGHGGTAVGTVNVAVSAVVNQGSAQISFAADGSVTLTFWGIPGQTYTIQRSSDLSTWNDLSPSVAALTSQPYGKISFTDSGPPAFTGYYRLKP